MIEINTEKALVNASKLGEIKKPEEVFKKACCNILKIDKNNWIRKFVFIIIELVFSIIMAVQTSTVPIAKEAFQVLLSINITLLAILFTGYGIFQALINDKLLVVLLSVDKGDLSESNQYFVEVMFFQIFCLMINIFIVLFCIVIPENWCLLHFDDVNTLLAGIGICPILHINIEAIWEMRSFIFNMYQLFNLHALSRITEINMTDKHHSSCGNRHNYENSAKKFH